MPSRICPCLGCTEHSGSCPTITTGGRCHPCSTALNRARGTSTQRGYDASHRAERLRLARQLQRHGHLTCARCGGTITTDDAWDLGHNDERTAWTGPEHANACNRSAGGARAHLP